MLKPAYEGDLNFVVVQFCSLLMQQPKGFMS